MSPTAVVPKRDSAAVQQQPATAGESPAQLMEARMASYLIRSVLHRGQGEHYAELHEQMERLGCSRTITANDGQIYDLPDAEYFLRSASSAVAIRDRVADIADAIRPNPSVLVTEFENCAFQLVLWPGES